MMSDRQDKIEELLSEWEMLWELGIDRDPGELCDDTDLKRELVSRVKKLRMMKRLIDGLVEPADLPMAWTTGRELVKGYRLESRLGKGSFGDVWSAENQNGFRAALKFVDLKHQSFDEMAKHHPEVRALAIIKRVRHSNLVHTFDAHRDSRYLIVFMELAQGSLADELEADTPRHELLSWFDAIASALDFLNEPNHCVDNSDAVGIQHCDVKPGNILRVEGGVKLADFSLAQLRKDTIASGKGGCTFAYASPEVFSKKVSKWSDQYSLAVTYCHLRGGGLPFAGNEAQIVAGHMYGAPDLSMLAPSEAAVVGRALQKEPSARWRNCCEFIEQLRRCDADRSWGTQNRVPAARVTVPHINSIPLAIQEQHRVAEALGLPVNFASNTGINLRLIPDGCFSMGAAGDDECADINERPQITVTIEEPFWAAEFPLTNGIVREFLRDPEAREDKEFNSLLDDASFARRCRASQEPDELPATEINDSDIQILCRWLSRRDDISYRIPTEAEWEYMARAGSTHWWWWGEPDDSTLKIVKNMALPDAGRANAWGLIDVLGNVNEWTASEYGRLTDGRAMKAASGGAGSRVVRGGTGSLTSSRLSARISKRFDCRDALVGVRLISVISSIGSAFHEKY